MAKTKKLNINTVNVIETNNGIPINLISYTDNEIGNELSEQLFARIAREKGAKVKNINSHIEDGFYENGTYTVYLVHSS